jgi:hypothetical protein
MRTKTLALSALLGALTTASVVAQTNVYSLNAVGYINVTLYPGYNIITCPLICSPDNTIGTLLNNSNGAFQGTGHPILHAQVFQLSANNLPNTTDTSGNSGGNGWESGGTITINPGQSVYFFNPEPLGTGSNMVATWVGTVPQNSTALSSQLPTGLTNYLAPGYNLVGSIVPAVGDIITNSIMALTNMTPTKFDTIYTYDPTYNVGSGQQGGFTTEGTASWTKAQGWNAGGQGADPYTFTVYNGFWYYNNNATTTNTWIENFSINP